LNSNIYIVDNQTITHRPPAERLRLARLICGIPRPNHLRWRGLRSGLDFRAVKGLVSCLSGAIRICGIFGVWYNMAVSIIVALCGRQAILRLGDKGQRAVCVDIEGFQVAGTFNLQSSRQSKAGHGEMKRGACPGEGVVLEGRDIYKSPLKNIEIISLKTAKAIFEYLKVRVFSCEGCLC